MSADRPDPRPDEPEPRLDVDAAFAAIVARWEPTPAPEGEATNPPVVPPEPEAPPVPAAPDAASLRGLFQPAWSDPLDTEASWEDEGHFVPQPPPPLPALDPRRKAAWISLIGSPVVAFVLAIAGVTLPRLVMVFLVSAFVGGFGYLVATMSSSPPDDWSGDDGARI